MRVLMTTDTLGGVWTFSRELAAGLLRNRCPVALVSFGRKPSHDQQAWLEQFAQQWGDRFHYEASEIPLEWMPDNAGTYSDAAPVLMKLAREFAPGLFLTNQFCFGTLPLDIPKVVVAHSDVFSWAEQCRDDILEDSVWLRCYRELVQAGLTEADTVVAPTRWMLEALSGNFQLPEHSIVIPNGRSIAIRELRLRRLQAITAGRLWDEAKNIAVLREVECPIPLLIAGEESPAGALQIPNATFLGILPPDQLLTTFRESSIYLCTSRYEPFGLAPLEAASCGCAVVANDIPSLREVWQDGALYFSDAASLTALLRELCADTQRLRSAQQNSRKRARHFTAQRMVDAYLRLFRSLRAQSEERPYAA